MQQVASANDRLPLIKKENIMSVVILNLIDKSLFMNAYVFDEPSTTIRITNDYEKRKRARMSAFSQMSYLLTSCPVFCQKNHRIKCKHKYGR